MHHLMQHQMDDILLDENGGFGTQSSEPRIICWTTEHLS